MKKQNRKKNITKKKKTLLIKSDQLKLVQHVKIVIKFCCRIMQLSQTKLFNKKKTRGNESATRGCTRRLKTTTIYEEKEKKS
jgi:hypothetical protein